MAPFETTCNQKLHVSQSLAMARLMPVPEIPGEDQKPQDKFGKIRNRASAVSSTAKMTFFISYPSKPAES